MKYNSSGMPVRLVRWLFRVAEFFITLALASCGGAGSDLSIAESPNTMKLAAASTVVAPDVVVIGIAKLSETRVSRTVYDYVFQVSVKNNGADAKNSVTATLTRVGAGASIVDGAVQVGDLAAGAAVTPTDTITIRQDRTQPFDQSALVWRITAMPISPSISGVFLSGDPNQPADQATIDFVDQGRDLSTAREPGSGVDYYTSQLIAFITPGSKVGQVNAVLNSVNGRISYMRQKDIAVTIHVLNTGSLAALRVIATDLTATGVFEVVTPSFVPKSQAIPNNVTQAEAFLPIDQDTHKNPVAHHIAARVSAAWNAANVRISSPKVELIVVDYFGNGKIAEINGTADGVLSGYVCDIEDYSGAVVGQESCKHGYHVLGIAAGSFGGGDTDTGKVTGSLPKTIPIHIIDLARPPGFPLGPFEELFSRKMREIVIASPNSRFVINMSLGCNDIVGNCLLPEVAKEGAKSWRKLVKNLSSNLPPGVVFNYESQVIQVSSAGNGGPSAIAERNSFWNAAVLLGPLSGTQPLENGLVVENRTSELSPGGIFVPGSLNEFCDHKKIPIPLNCKDSELDGSTRGGNVGAIGTNVYSFISPTEVGILSGTSMAAPQVAGISAYMFAIRPNMSPKELVNKIIGTSQAPLAGAAPMMDAFAAILSLDKSFMDAPVRLAMLQPNVDPPADHFTYADAIKFLQAFFPSAYSPMNMRINPDLSRFDLNGDGFTGDALKKSAFNLDFSTIHPPVGLVEKYDVGGQAIELNRAELTDFEVLCYYVHSPLFDAGGLSAFNSELVRISGLIGRSVSCAYPPHVLLSVQTKNSGWVGLPADIRISGFALTNKSEFNKQGDPGNTCGGERGSPLPFSNAVDSSATFYSVTTVVGVPINLGGPGINRRPCSSFFASSSSGSGLLDQVWINATGRGQNTSNLDWEIQIRYSNGDPRGPFPDLGKQCEVGVVGNADFFSKSFDAQCNHFYFGKNSVVE